MSERPSGRSVESTVAAESEAAPSARARYAAERGRRVESLCRTLRTLVDGMPRTCERVLELGCGHGHFLTAFAKQHPTVQCLGVDYCRDRIRRAERKLRRSELANLQLVCAEVGEVLEAMPDEVGFREVFVLFPDPWPKRRHRKHRLVTAALFDRLARIGGAGCRFFFRSDALDYVMDVRATICAHPRWLLQPALELPVETETVFQAKAPRFHSLAAFLTS